MRNRTSKFLFLWKWKRVSRWFSLLWGILKLLAFVYQSLKFALAALTGSPDIAYWPFICFPLRYVNDLPWQCNICEKIIYLSIKQLKGKTLQTCYKLKCEVFWNSMKCKQFFFFSEMTQNNRLMIASYRIWKAWVYSSVCTQKCCLCIHFITIL